jgi:hypothetical protein
MMKTDVSTPTSLNEISLDLKFMDWPIHGNHENNDFAVSFLLNTTFYDRKKIR